MAIKQLHVVTWVKFQLKQELLCKQLEQDTKEDWLIATYNREIGKIKAKVGKEIDHSPVPGRCCQVERKAS